MKKTFTIRFFTPLAILGMPIFVYADSGNFTYLKYYYELVLTVVNVYLVPMLIAVAFITFLWGVYKYFIVPDGEREEGKQFIMYGLIGFVIIVSVWGLVNMVKTTLIAPTAGNNVPSSYPSSLPK